MMKNVYEIETELALYVMAENKEDAIEVALNHIQEEAGNLRESDLSVTENPLYVRAEWENSEPYEGNDSKKVGEIIENIREQKRLEQERIEWEKKQLKLFTATKI